MILKFIAGTFIGLFGGGLALAEMSVKSITSSKNKTAKLMGMTMLPIILPAMFTAGTIFGLLGGGAILSTEAYNSKNKIEN